MYSASVASLAGVSELPCIAPTSRHWQSAGTAMYSAFVACLRQDKNAINQKLLVRRRYPDNPTLVFSQLPCMTLNIKKTVLEIKPAGLLVVPLETGKALGGISPSYGGGRMAGNS